IAAMADRDPIKLLRDDLIREGALTMEAFEALQQEIIESVDADYRRAEVAEDPRPEEYMLHMDGDPVAPTRPP
ncbi:MAG TPA: 2-oxoisovalerate dehydrogenase, partial [Armatimonadetes bacterium]|nr:2-oxoisovalerate dehydrogenase [Armatimonadota bacterium]